MQNNLKSLSAYLVGAIDYCPEYGRTWRREIKQFLQQYKIGVMDPTDKPILNSKYDEDKKNVNKINNLKAAGKYDEAALIMKNIVRADLSLLDRADFIIAYIDTSIHHCGSYSEITYGALERKPILLVCRQGKVGVPNWLYGLIPHKLFFNNFNELKFYIKTLTELPIEKIDDVGGRWKFLDYKKIYNV